MRQILSVVVSVLFSFTVYAQTNSINYKVLIKDNLGNVVANQTVTVQFTILQSANNVYQETHTPTTDANGIVVLNIGDGTTADDFKNLIWSDTHYWLKTEIDTEQDGSFELISTTQFKSVPYALNVGLETLSEGNGYGLRLKRSDPENFGNIGYGALDLSTSGSPSTTHGATGSTSVAIGYNTIASGTSSLAFGNNLESSGSNSIALGRFTISSGQYSMAMGNFTEATNYSATSMGNNTLATGSTSTAMGSITIASGDYTTAMGRITKAEAYASTAIGQYNIGGGDPEDWVETDPLFEIGNSELGSPRSNALTVLKNGTITAPSLDLAEITDDKALITKEYADTNLITSGLEALDEGTGIGWRLKDVDPANYGNIRFNAVDLSISTSASSFNGATAVHSFAAGSNTRASGNFSTAMGQGSIASGVLSTAFGIGSQATGYGSIAIGHFPEASGTSSISMGILSKADANRSISLGSYNIGGGDPEDWVETDPLFEIGNSELGTPRSNAITVLKNGTITAPSFDLAEITDDKALITKEYADTNLIASGLEALDEGNGIGWRLKGKDPDNYGNLGEGAVDFSHSIAASTSRGATGLYSTAFGIHTIASGDGSIALGNTVTASGLNSTAMGNSSWAEGAYSNVFGYFNHALGNYSTAMGIETKAEALALTAIGSFNIGGGTIDDWIGTDPLFEIGNGQDNANRDNAITVLKNGKVGIGEHQPAGFLEIKANNSTSSPTIRLIQEGSSGPRINFTNTGVTNGNYWTLYGDPDDVDANSVFNIYHPNAGNIVRVQGDGEVGINGIPNTEFHVYHNNDAANSGFKLQNTDANNNWWRLFTSDANGNLYIYSTVGGSAPRGNFDKFTGVYSSASDRRLKKGFKPLPFSWQNFMNLETLSYLYKSQTNNKRSLGLIAQDVENIYPELVSYNTESDVYHLNYSGFGVIAIKAIQEQQKTIKEQQKKINKLTEELNLLKSLDSRVKHLEALLNTPKQ